MIVFVRNPKVRRVVDDPMRRTARVFAWTTAIYAAGWVAYVLKSAAGVDLIAYDTPVVGGHHGGYFPGSDAAVDWLRHLKRHPAL